MWWPPSGAFLSLSSTSGVRIDSPSPTVSTEATKLRSVQVEKPLFLAAASADAESAARALGATAMATIAPPSKHADLILCATFPLIVGLLIAVRREATAR